MPINSPWRKDFPILQQQINQHPLVYLDSAATTQKPQVVVDAICTHYQENNANVHRGLHTLSARSDTAYEGVRDQVQAFIQAQKREEIIFVRGATEGINLVAHSFALSHCQKDDIILISAMEHHANIVPWQWVAEQTGARCEVIPLNEKGDIDTAHYDEQLKNGRVKIVAITHASNVLGTVNPIKHICHEAKKAGAITVVDAAQSIAHRPIDVQDIDCDFLVFSAHKAYGPTGIGVLYAKHTLHKLMSPYQRGGDMIETVSFEKTTFNHAPYKFEAGTPNITGVIGMGAALNYLSNIGWREIHTHEVSLNNALKDLLGQFPRCKHYHHATDTIGVFSMHWQGIHPHDAATILDQYGVAARAGHHCAMPLIQSLKQPALLRVSLGLYNNSNDINALGTALNAMESLFPHQTKSEMADV